jgi:Domain of unknown function DUF11
MNRPTTPVTRRSNGIRKLARLTALSGVAVTLGVAALTLPADAATKARPDLEVTVGTAYWKVWAGGQAPFTAYVTNVGTATAPASTVKVNIPPSMLGSVAFAGTDGPGNCSIVGTVLSCSLGKLAPGESNDATVAINGAKGGSFRVTAHVDPVRGETKVANNDGEAQVVVNKFPTTITTVAPPSVRTGQILPIAVSVNYAPLSGVSEPSGKPTGTVTAVGPEGTFTAKVVNGVASIAYPATLHGTHSVTVTYTGSDLASSAAKTIGFTVL